MKKYKVFATPYLIWMAVLTLLPMLIMALLSFLKLEGFNLSSISLSLSAFEKTFNRETIIAFSNSMKLATIATLLCILLGYPLAYIVSKLYKSL